jgi:hypothetical protein
MREIAGVPRSLIDRFSTRRAAVLATYQRLEAEWRQIHGRTPTHDEKAGMMDEATTRSRYRKARGDVDLHDEWRDGATLAELIALSGVIATAVEIDDGGRLPAGSPHLADRVFTELHEQRAWWTRAHVTGEVARLIADPTPEAIEVETERIIAMRVSLEVDDDPEYADWGAAKYTSEIIQTAEERVLTSATEDRAAFAIDTIRDPALGDDQVAAVEEIARGGGRVATIVGPAGAGKTTMLRSVAASYQAAGREVIVLTLSAAAAWVVTDETGLAAHTIAAWRVGAVDMPRDSVVIVDEASMVPTLVPRRDGPHRRCVRIKDRAHRRLHADGRTRSRRPPPRPRGAADSGRAHRRPPLPAAVGSRRLPSTPSTQPRDRRHLPAATTDRRVKHRHRVRRRGHRMVGRHRRRAPVAHRRRHRQRRRRRQYPLPAPPHGRRPARRIRR